MKRFYKGAAVAASDSGHTILLDGRPVRTPARAPLAVPTPALAQAIAAEWDAQGDEIDPRTMMMTGLANAAIDQVAPDAAAFAAAIAAYGESDLLCYRAEGPAPLVREQIEAWNPLLDWAERRYDVSFALATGIVHVAQPDATITRLTAAVAACDPFVMTGLSTLVTMSGSLVCGLAILEQAFPVEHIWQASELDELWQARQWGEDEQAAARRTLRAEEFTAATRFVELAQG